MALSIKSTLKLNSGYEIPVLGFGVYQTPPEVIAGIMPTTFAAGYRINEAECAEAIRKSGLPRSEVFFTSKVPSSGMSYEGAKAQVAKTLALTKFDYIDLLLLHAPYGGSAGRKGAWKALVEAVEEGKVRSIGVSNYGVHHLNELEQHMAEIEAERGGQKGQGGVLSVGQWEIHPWCPREDIVQWCQKRGVVVEAYCPLLQGKRWGEPAVAKLAAKYGVSEAQVLLRWSLQKGYVPLPKSVTPKRIEDNTHLYNFSLTDEEVQGLTSKGYEPVSWDPTIEPLDK